MNNETRTLNFEVRAIDNDEGATKIVGKAAVFNSRSENLGGFVEIIAPGAFDDVLEDDVRALFNHDKNIVLGRNGKTLRLFIDSDGLNYEIDAPDTQLIRDMVIAPMKRGDINQSSFGFRVAPNGDRWDEDDDGIIVRTITRMSKLFDVSPVTYPAYTNSSSTTRSLGAFIDENKKDEEERSVDQARWKAQTERYLQTL